MGGRRIERDTPVSDQVIGGSAPVDDPCDPCRCLMQFYELITAPRPPYLYRAELYAQPEFEYPKTDRTGLYVSVKTSDEKALLATLVDGYGNFTWGEFSPNTIPLVVEAPGATRTECDGFKVNVWLSLGVVSLWRILRVTLFFSDGTTLLAETGSAEIPVEIHGDTCSFASP